MKLWKLCIGLVLLGPLCAWWVISHQIIEVEPVRYASWYSEKSTLAEGYSLVMANGEELNDEEFTCASWDYPFGTYLVVTNLENGQRALVRVTDRGPNKALVKRGRTIDLSVAAFSALDDLDKGVIGVKIEELKR